MTPKTLALALASLAAVTALVAHANRPLDLHALDHLAALDAHAHDDDAPDHDRAHTLCDTFAWVNEHALHVLPVAATLRLEDAIAGASLALEGDAGDDVRVAATPAQPGAT